MLQISGQIFTVAEQKRIAGSGDTFKKQGVFCPFWSAMHMQILVGEFV